MTEPRRLYFLIMVMVMVMATLATTPAQAAQNAMVTVEKAEIHASRALDSPVIEAKPAGTQIRISSRDKDGWYKIKTTSGQFGWIWQADVAVLGAANDAHALGLNARATKSERQPYKQPQVYLMGGGGEFAIFPADLNDRLNQKANNYYLGRSYFGQIAVRMDERLRVAFRVMSYDFTSDISTNDKKYSLQFSSLPILLGFENALFQDDRFEVMAGLFGGLGYNNRLAIVSIDDAAPNSVVFETSDWALLFTVDFKYWFSRHISLLVEGGVYFSQQTSVSVSTPFNGSNTFIDPASGGFAAFNVNHFGPVVSAALEVGF